MIGRHFNYGQFGMFFDNFANMRTLLILIIISPAVLQAQNYFSQHFGGSAGLSIHFGSHVNGIGVNLNAYYSDYFFQVNAGSSLQFKFTGYGKRTKFWENRNVLGLVLVAGKQNSPVQFSMDGLNHQRGHDYGLGYNYVFYFDNKGTSQLSGGMAVHLKQFSVYHENDFFAGRAGDRYRTAHFLFSYQQDFYRIGLGMNLWTGETRGGRIEPITSKKSPNGFKVLEDLPYGKTSHGLLYASFQGTLPYGQHAFMRIGVDSEHVRHAMQNRLIHDLAFIPGLSKRMRRTTPHYPRLDESGCPAFSKEDARRSKPFIYFGLNDNWSD